jgi:hypothetical protein
LPILEMIASGDTGRSRGRGSGLPTRAIQFQFSVDIPEVDGQLRAGAH